MIAPSDGNESGEQRAGATPAHRYFKGVARTYSGWRAMWVSFPQTGRQAGQLALSSFLKRTGTDSEREQEVAME